MLPIPSFNEIIFAPSSRLMASSFVLFFSFWKKNCMHSNFWENTVLFSYAFTPNDPRICGRCVLIHMLMPLLSSHLPKCWPRLWVLWVHTLSCYQVLLSGSIHTFLPRGWSPSGDACGVTFFFMLGVQSLVISWILSLASVNSLCFYCLVGQFKISFFIWLLVINFFIFSVSWLFD